MEPDFWHDKWRKGQIGFHQDAVHDDLVGHADWLLGGGPRRVLVPLCGKSRDLHWMARQGHAVAGVELSRLAAEAMHAEQGLDWTVDPLGPYTRLRSGSGQVLVGNVLDLGPDLAAGALGGAPDRLWDRAALVALRPADRQRYVDTLTAVLAPGARVLLAALAYDPAVMDGPPWSVDEPTVRALWSHADVTLLDRQELVEDEPRWRERGHQTFRRELYAITLPG